MIADCTDRTRWIPNSDMICRNQVGDHRSGADDAAVADGNSWHDDYVAANETVLSGCHEPAQARPVSALTLSPVDGMCYA